MSIILGIDPGTTTTGFAVIASEKQKIDILEYGVITTPPKLSLDTKLLELGSDIESIIEKYRPEICGIEKLFFFNNQKTAIDVAQARGTIVYMLAKHGIPIIEYTPLQVKSGICGNGNANKKQVQNALKLILKLPSIPKPDDAADALAIAWLTNSKKFIKS
jgi:crossover junction endodeoxyribonuclease RuvC